MDATSPNRAWWSYRPSPPPRSVVELIRAGTMDPALAAMLWLLVEARVPLVVAALRSGTGKTTLLESLMDFLPAGTRRVDLAGVTETFDWLPHARELGWIAPAPAAPQAGRQEHLHPANSWLVAHELSDHLPIYTWGDAARVAVRAITVGYGLGATIHADSLEEVFDALHRPPVALTDDELSRLGVVLVLRAYAPPPGDVNTGPVRRVVAAHYVRPIFRDGHGHVQRLGPAVLATWDEARDRFEHFAWGVLPELAERTGRHAGDLEAELVRREEYLAGLAAAGVTEVGAVRDAIEGFRAAVSTAAGNPN